MEVKQIGEVYSRYQLMPFGIVLDQGE